MRRTSFPVVIAAMAAILTACESSTVVNPRETADGAASLARSAGPSSSCTITLPAPAHRPLPAVREITRELNEAFAHSSLNCGIVAGIGSRMNTLVSKLDQVDGEQNLDAACGIAGSLVNQLEELVKNGSLNPIVTHPPEASPNVVDNMAFIRSQFCTNAGHTSGEPGL